MRKSCDRPYCGMSAPQSVSRRSLEIASWKERDPPLTLTLSQELSTGFAQPSYCPVGLVGGQESTTTARGEFRQDRRNLPTSYPRSTYPLLEGQGDSQLEPDCPTLIGSRVTVFFPSLLLMDSVLRRVF